MAVAKGFDAGLPKVMAHQAAMSLMCTPASDVQPAKASLPMPVTEAGMVIDSRAEQPLKQYGLIVVRASGSDAETRAVQPSKALVPIAETVAGSSTDLRPSQP